MKAVILAAGRGTRLSPLTDTVPKPLLIVAGRTILNRTLNLLPSQVTEIVIVVGYMKEAIMEQIGTEYRGRPVHYVEQKELKGTGHAIHACQEILGNSRFLALNGDDLYASTDLSALIAASPAILIAPQPEGATRFSAAMLRKDGTLLSFQEGKPGPVNAGAYALDARFFHFPLVPIKDGTEFGLPQTIALMAAEIPVRTVTATRWTPIGTPEELAAAEISFS